MNSLRSLLSQVVPPFVLSLLKRAYQYTMNSSESRVDRELLRLQKSEPGHQGSTDIFGQRFEFTDARSFVSQYKSFFVRQQYSFTAPTERPKIIDCGANMGVSVLWWKYIYPDAEIIAFEADPEIFKLLEKNCSHLQGVTLCNAAVWIRDGEMPFSATGGEGGRLVDSSEEKSAKNVLKVRTVRLRDYLVTGCDFLKVDIEGAEVEVIEDCKDLLHHARLIFLEFHSFFHKAQALASFLMHFQSAGFRMHIHTELPSPSPFRELLCFNQKDLRLNLFCFQDGEYPPIRLLG